MARINITRFPNATPEYDPQQFDAMVRLLEQIVLINMILVLKQKLSLGFWSIKWLILM